MFPFTKMDIQWCSSSLCFHTISGINPNVHQQGILYRLWFNHIMECSEDIENDDVDLYFLTWKVFTLTWKDIHITWGGGKTYGDLEDFWKYPRKNKCVWVSTETGLDVATPNYRLWLWLRGMFTSDFYSINFCIVWVSISGKLKSGELAEMVPFLLHTK